MWTKNQVKFVKQVKGQTEPEKIREVVDEYFDIPNKKDAPAFHEAVMQLYKTKTTDTQAIESLKPLYDVYRALYPNDKTLRQRLSEIRTKAIQKHQSEKVYAVSKRDSHFNLPEANRVAIVEAYKESIKAKNADKIQVDETLIYAKLTELALSKNVYEKIIVVLLASGSRSVEVFSKSKYSLMSGNDSYIRIDGLAKKRQTQIDEGHDWVEKPVLFLTPKTLVRLVKEIRNHFKNKVVIDDNGVLAKDKSATLNKYVVQHFPFLEDLHYKSSFLRKIYADLSYKNFADKATTNYNSWISRVLGHEDMLTSFSYSFVNVVNPDKYEKKDEISSELELMKAQIKLLQNQLDKKNPEQPTVAEPDTEPRGKPRESDESKIERLEKIWTANPNISNSSLRAKSHLGSKVVNKFLTSKKEKEET